MSNFTLLAIPYFIFMGAVLEKSGIAERLLETIGIVLGRVRGGVGISRGFNWGVAGGNDRGCGCHRGGNGIDLLANNAAVGI